MIALNVVTVTVPDCPSGGPGSHIDGTVIGWGLFLTALVLAVFIGSVAAVRVKVHEARLAHYTLRARELEQHVDNLS